MSEMRQSKFRAWDRHNKVWIGPYTLKQLAGDDQFNYDTEVHPISSKFEDFDWVEYTGMKDRQGREIYESDIVRYDAIDTVGIVTWSTTYPGFIILNPEKTGAFVIHSEWEVLGNIYESELPA